MRKNSQKLVLRRERVAVLRQINGGIQNTNATLQAPAPGVSLKSACAAPNPNTLPPGTAPTP